MRSRISSPHPKDVIHAAINGGFEIFVCADGDNMRVRAHGLVDRIDPELPAEHVDRIRAKDVKTEPSHELVRELLEAESRGKLPGFPQNPRHVAAEEKPVFTVARPRFPHHCADTLVQAVLVELPVHHEPG